MLHGTRNVAQISYGAGFSAAIGSVVQVLNGTSIPIDQLPEALDAMNYTGITGPTYLLPGASKNLRRSVYCQQRGNDSSVAGGR